tara:strand:- start:148198 stop:149370 length:1173 start_codon:yes stop_codon:yes gene_type:complete
LNRDANAGDAWFPLLVTLCLSVTGTLIFKVLPLVVGAAAESYALSPSQLGQLASSDLAGIAVASVVAPLWVRRVDWRSAARVALLLVIVGNVLSIKYFSFDALLAVRFVTGLGEGTATGLALVILGDSRNPDRNFGMAMAAPILLGVVGFKFLPLVIAQAGFAGVMMVLAAVSTVIFLLLSGLPRAGYRNHERRERVGGSTALVFLALLATFFNHLAIGAVWAFVERLGDAAGLARDTVSAALGIAVMLGFCGAVCATFQGGRWGRGLPLTLSVLGQLLALYLLSLVSTPSQFRIAVCLFQFCWLYAGAYQLATIARVDSSGRFFVLTIAFQAGGITVGPALAGALIEKAGFSPMLFVAGLAFVVSIVLFWWVLGVARNVSPQAAHAVHL